MSSAKKEKVLGSLRFLTAQKIFIRKSRWRLKNILFIYFLLTSIIEPLITKLLEQIYI